VVAFPDKYGRMLARVRPHGRRWGPLQHIGPAAGGTENDVTPFVGAHGAVVVAWYETQLCSGGCESPGFTRVAVQPAGASRFRAPQLLRRDPVPLLGAPAGRRLAPIVIAATGRAPMVIFLAHGLPVPFGSRITPTVVLVSYPRGLGFAPPQAVSAADEQAELPAAAAGPHGVLLTWIRADAPFNGGTVLAAVLSTMPGGFGPPEQASPSEHVRSVVPMFNSASRWLLNIPPWMLAWSSQPNRALGSFGELLRVSAPVCPLASAPAPPAADPACLAG